MLRIKLNRLKWITFILVGIILSMVVTDYKNDREKLFMAVDKYFGTQRELPDLFGVIKDKENSDLRNIEQVVFQLSEDRIALEEHFNFIEKMKLDDTDYYLSMETSAFNKLIKIMQYRYDQGIDLKPIKQPTRSCRIILTI